MNQEFSYFIENKGLFGSYPSGFLDTLQDLGVIHFIDLTHPTDELPPYNTDFKEDETKSCNYISYPIYDRSIPNDYHSFCQVIISVSELINNLKNNEKIYIHCKGGHGRSGILVACILCYMNKTPPAKSIELTTQYHNNRDIKLKWKKIGSPQTRKQKNFIFRLFQPIYFYKSFKNTPTYGFSTFSPHPIETKMGTFPTVEAAFNAYKDIKNHEYVTKLKNSISPYYSRQLGKTKTESVEFKVNKYNIMYNLYILKYKQYLIFRHNLKQTFLRPIIFNAKNDTYWGNGCNSINPNGGLNCLGNILTNLRNELIFDTPQLTNII